MKKMVYGLLAISLIANIYFVLNPVTKTVEVVKEVARPSQPTQIIASEAKETVSQLAEGEGEYLAEIERLKSEIEALKEQSEQPPKISSGPTYHQFSDSAELPEDLQKQLALSRDISKEFASEAVDPAWAFSQQDLLYETLINSELANQLNIKNVTCKTSSCKISLETFDDSRAAKMMAMIGTSELFAKHESLADYRTQAQMDEDSNDIDIYIFQAGDI